MQNYKKQVQKSEAATVNKSPTVKTINCLVNRSRTGQLALNRSKLPLTVKPAATSSETQTEKLPVLATPDQPLEDHPIAEIFPTLSEDRLQELADDIKARGLQQPIVPTKARSWTVAIRYRACIAAKAKISYEEYKGNDPVAFVLSRNVYRRHLIDRQRAMVAARLIKFERSEPTNIARVCRLAEPLSS